jgi:hypothetical protein
MWRKEKWGKEMNEVRRKEGDHEVEEKASTLWNRNV